MIPLDLLVPRTSAKQFVSILRKQLLYPLQIILGSNFCKWLTTFNLNFSCNWKINTSTIDSRVVIIYLHSNVLENLLWHLHLLQIQQYTAIKTLLLDIPYMSIRIILNLLVYNVSYICQSCVKPHFQRRTLLASFLNRNVNMNMVIQICVFNS